MITQLSKWLLYIAANKWVYALQLVGIIYYGTANIENDISKYDKILIAVHSNSIVISLLMALIIFAIIIQRGFQKLDNNTRIHYPIDSGPHFDIPFSFLANILAILALQFDTFGLLVVVTADLLCGWLFVLYDTIGYLPMLLIKGYRVYTSGNVKIITKMTLDQYKLRMEESPEGIEAREVVKSTFIILEKNRK